MHDMQAARGASLSDADIQSSPPAIRRRRVGVLVAVAAATLATDVAAKVAAVASLSDRPPIELLGGLLTLRLTRNSGAAFSLAEGYTMVFTAVAAVVVVVIARVARRLSSLGWAIALGLLLGGAIGNLADRIFRSPGVFRGHVVDFLELPHWPVFNIADSAIVSAGALMVLLAARGIEADGGHRHE
jgi:signal peptidase II